MMVQVPEEELKMMVQVPEEELKTHKRFRKLYTAWLQLLNSNWNKFISSETVEEMHERMLFYLLTTADN